MIRFYRNICVLRSRNKNLEINHRSDSIIKKFYNYSNINFLMTMTRPCRKDEENKDGDDPYLGKVVQIEVMDGAPDPIIKSPNEYPDWLWNLLEEKPSLQDLTRKYKSGQELTLDEMGRIVKLQNRGKIKASNESGDMF